MKKFVAKLCYIVAAVVSYVMVGHVVGLYVYLLCQYYGTQMNNSVLVTVTPDVAFVFVIPYVMVILLLLLAAWRFGKRGGHREPKAKHRGGERVHLQDRF